MSRVQMLRKHGWRAGHPGSGIEELWQHPSGPGMGWYTADAALLQLAMDLEAALEDAKRGGA